MHPDELNAAYIIPSVFHPDVSKVVAAAVKAAVLGTTVEEAESLPSIDAEDAQFIG